MGTWCHGQRGKAAPESPETEPWKGRERAEGPEEGGPLLVSMVGDADVSRADPRLQAWGATQSHCPWCPRLHSQITVHAGCLGSSRLSTATEARPPALILDRAPRDTVQVWWGLSGLEVTLPTTPEPSPALGSLRWAEAEAANARHDPGWQDSSLGPGRDDTV